MACRKWGISPKRGSWILEWIRKAEESKFVVQARSFAEFLGRLGFISQLLIWPRPHLAPLFAWSAVVAPGLVGRLPDVVILTIKYISVELVRETYTVSTKRLVVHELESFRTDAKCTDEYIILGGWELKTRRWFSLKLLERDVPFMFKDGKGAMWASASAELLATLVALHAFGWLVPSKDRKSIPISLAAGIDNRSNEALSLKRSTTKWPLMAINMQLSSAISRSRLSLILRWRPRDENEEADDLTNERFSGFDMLDRIVVGLDDIDLSVVNSLCETRQQYLLARDRAKSAGRSVKRPPKKNFEKSPW